MSSLHLDIPHELPKEEAISRIKSLLSKLVEEKKDLVSNVKEEWQGDKGVFSFTAQGFNLSGEIGVDNGKVQIDSKLPMAVALFKGVISDMIRRKAEELLK